MGSSPIRRTRAVGSSIGGAPGCGPGGWRFKSVPSAHGTLAQLVELQTENLPVPGSIPGGSADSDKAGGDCPRTMSLQMALFGVPVFLFLGAVEKRLGSK